MQRLAAPLYHRVASYLYFSTHLFELSPTRTDLGSGGSVGENTYAMEKAIVLLCSVHQVGVIALPK